MLSPHTFNKGRGRVLIGLNSGLPQHRLKRRGLCTHSNKCSVHQAFGITGSLARFDIQASVMQALLVVNSKGSYCVGSQEVTDLKVGGRTLRRETNAVLWDVCFSTHYLGDVLLGCLESHTKCTITGSSLIEAHLTGLPILIFVCRPKLNFMASWWPIVHYSPKTNQHVTVY